MKRNRAECPQISRVPTDAPAKTKRSLKDAWPKTAARARATALAPATPMGTENHRKGLREEENLAQQATAAGTECSSLPEATVAGEVVWDVGAAEFGGWWWWGVEEEKLLGWFPFAAEHFLGSGNRGYGDLLWEEEEEDRDIWQLQHIHEIPNRAK